MRWKSKKIIMKVAYRIYPKPNGTIYTENDIKDIEDVVELFDYCQILEAIIYKQGWGYLIERFGMEELYKADKKSGWHESENLDDFVRNIEHEKSISL